MRDSGLYLKEDVERDILEVGLMIRLGSERGIIRLRMSGMILKVL